MRALRGVLASQIQGRLSSFESIATVNLNGTGSTDVQFLSIPQTYTHLQLRVSCQPSTTQGKLNFNADTTDANYYSHYLNGNGASVGAGSVANPNLLPGGLSNGQPAVLLIDILDYTNANKYKTARILFGQDTNGGGQVALSSVVWLNVAAITRIDLTTATWNTGIMALYGIKG